MTKKLDLGKRTGFVALLPRWKDLGVLIPVLTGNEDILPVKQRLKFDLDPSWSSSQIANAIMETTRKFYGARLNVEQAHTVMEEIWVELQEALTEEEKLRLRDVVQLSVPLNDFNARIVTPPSRKGQYILFDAILDLRLLEVFLAPRNVTAWASAYIRAAWSGDYTVAYWVEQRFKFWETNFDPKAVPDSYSVEAARRFIMAHEYGHFFLNHLHSGAKRTFNFGSEDLTVFEPALQQEIEADAFARDLLCRAARIPLCLQQMGVDWLFGFMGTILAMRSRAKARRQGRPELPIMDTDMALRRRLCWEDYDRRRAQSPSDFDRMPANVANMERVRQSVDDFNEHTPAWLADLYAEMPDELMYVMKRLLAGPMTEYENEDLMQTLSRMADEADRRHHTVLRRSKRRLHSLVERFF